MPGFEDERLVKLKESTIKEDIETGKHELRFKFEIDSSFGPSLKDFCTKYKYNLFQYITFTVRQLIEDILCETKSQLEKQNSKEMEKKSDDQGKN